MQIQILDIILLSIYLIPNIISVIVPFILIFGLLLCFIKLNKENELTAIVSLGAGLDPLRKSLLIFSFIIIIIFTFLNFYLAPKIYKEYKNQEYNLRNTLDLNNMAFSNFLNLNKNTILDFKKNNNEYKDIFISFDDEKENLVYAKTGKIFTENNEYKFKLTDGFKISIDTEKQIEKLEFENYILKIENKSINDSEIIDKNTFTIFDDIKNKNNLNIAFKFFDVALILFIMYFFYINNLRKINFKTKNNIYFSLFCINALIVNQILKNSEVDLINYFLVISFIIIITLLISFLRNNYE